MSGSALWYLVSYDIRDPKRWRKAYKIVNGYGRSLQYSLFRCRLTVADLERLRWELERVLDSEDSLLFIGLCSACVDRVVARNRDGEWPAEAPRSATL
jgi:CRISPR-associated protein Cas2